MFFEQNSMIKFIFLWLLLLGAFSGALAQPSATSYADFILKKDFAWLLTRNGQLKAATLQANSKTNLLPNTDFQVVVMANDRKGRLVSADKNGQIRVFNESTKRWSVLTKSSEPVKGLLFDSQNNAYTVSDKGIRAADNLQTYFPADSLFLNNQIRLRTKWFEQPAYFMDNRDRIWIGFNYGEWGGDVFLFDTNKRKFIKPLLNGYPITTNPVQSFVQGPDRTVFMTAGVIHFTTHGSIVQFRDSLATVLLQTRDTWQPTNDSTQLQWLEGGHYIGPAAYNATQNCLYFYSQNGIFKGDLTSNLESVNNWKLVVRPKLDWTGGQRNAVGPAMNVLKMQFAENGTLFFLTEHNGLGTFDGKTIQFITSSR